MNKINCFKRLAVLLLTFVLMAGMCVPTLAAGVPSNAKVLAGRETTVEFRFDKISCFAGTLTYSNPGLFSEVQVSIVGNGYKDYNEKNGKVSYFYSAVEDRVTLVLKLKVAANANVNDSCVITFEYEATDDEPLPTIPVYTYDKVTVTVYAIDYTELNRQIAAAEALDSTKYTPQSWAALVTALNAAKSARQSDDQSVVDTAANNLKKAIADLKTATVSVDYSALKELIQTAKGLKESDYTAASWADLKAALSAAEAALNSTSQSEVDSAAAELRKAIDNLKIQAPVVDYSALKKLIQTAKDLNESDYTAASWAKLAAALKTAEAALNSDSQIEVDRAAEGLRNAIRDLETAPVPGKVNYAELKRQIAIAEGLKSSDYTAKSWGKLKTALAAAKAALTSDNQRTVDAAAAALQSAIAGLERVTGKNLDYTELKNQLAIAMELKREEYTADSWARLEAAWKTAQDALTSAKTQNVIDLATEELKNAINALVRMDYSKLLEAINAADALRDTEGLEGLFMKLHDQLILAQQMLQSNDQAEVDKCAEEIIKILAEIASELEKLKNKEPVVIEKPGPVDTSDPKDLFCNISSHRIWPILFWISFALNLAAIVLIVIFFVLKKKKRSDDIPLVDYDITDDAK